MRKDLGDGGICAATRILTLAELEALACFGATGLFTLDSTGVAGHEAFGAESGLVFRIDFDEGAGDGETESFGLAFVAATVEIDFNVIFF